MSTNAENAAALRVLSRRPMPTTELDRKVFSFWQEGSGSLSLPTGGKSSQLGATDHRRSETLQLALQLFYGGLLRHGPLSLSDDLD